jgi:hypothetical protein
VTGAVRISQLIGALALPALLALPAALPAQVTGRAAAAATPAAIPEKLSSAEYWKLLSDISEPGGYFQIEDNFTSNEGEVGQVSTLLRARMPASSVYMGVGPEQNFSYIAAIRPKFAFVVDIRRQAVVQHLMFKAIFEMSKDRADFLSNLFSRPRPAALDTTTDIRRIWDAYWYVPVDPAMQTKTYGLILDRLTKTHGFTLTSDELGQLRYIFDSFTRFGPEISTRGASSARGGGNNRSFADLTGYMPDSAGVIQSFLSTEDNYRFVKSMHDRNVIVPVSGDFGGPKAIRAVGSWVRQHGGTVSAFYVSNVEEYLFGDGKQHAFYANVATLPLSEASVFIRPYSLRRMNTAAASLCPIQSFLAAATAGRVQSNNVALACPR